MLKKKNEGIHRNIPTLFYYYLFLINTQGLEVPWNGNERCHTDYSSFVTWISLLAVSLWNPYATTLMVCFPMVFAVQL
jgi:hypothetical protein